ncbi:hypothetical protein [Actinomadura gamaensis]|uniref:Chromosome segregation ATPase n=1 Tax=Actinomadura gamaensis TaxID=1763541 RepID=A0ABV9U8L9_9ACTN
MDETERLRERVGELCAALIRRYERLEAELPETDRPLGWSGRLATLRAFAEGDASADWTALARLLVEPESADEDSARLVDLAGKDPASVVRQITDALDGRILLLAPSKTEAAALLETLADRELPLLLEEIVPPAPFRRREETGTVEFRPPTPAEAAEQDPSLLPALHPRQSSTGTAEFGTPIPVADATSPTVGLPTVADEDLPAAVPSSDATLRLETIPDDQEAAPTPDAPVLDANATRTESPHPATLDATLTDPPPSVPAAPTAENAPAEVSDTPAHDTNPTDAHTSTGPLPDAPTRADDVSATASDATAPHAAASDITATDATLVDAPPSHAVPPADGSGAAAEDARAGKWDGGSPDSTVVDMDAPGDGASDARAEGADVAGAGDVADGDAPGGGGSDAQAAGLDGVAGVDGAGVDGVGVDGLDAVVAGAGAEGRDAAEEAVCLEQVVRRIVVRPVGEVWREDWDRELRGLRLGLLWLEQWPRDVATVERLRESGVRRREEREAEIAALEAALVERRAELVSAQGAVAEAEAERERAAAEEERVAAEAVEPRQEAERLQAEANEAAARAGEAARVADEAYARVTAIDERTSQAQFELGAAREQEQQLVADLARAREELPAAKAETERLVSQDSNAIAEGHASYYRVRAAESAVAAVRQKMTLTQRLHVAPSPPELKKLRAELKDKVRQADDAARRAHETKEAAQRAAQHQAELERFLEGGGERLAAAKHAQTRLADELARLAAEREGAVAEHHEQARTAAEAADQATQAGASARFAEQTARAAEERLAVARTAREIAEAALERAEADVEAAASRITAADAALAERRASAETENAEDEKDLAVAIEAEERSRGQVAALCGDEEPDRCRLPDIQERAMSRIEELARCLSLLADSPHDVDSDFGRTLLRKATVVGGSPFAVASSDPGEFDELLVSGTERLDPDDLLVGAVHAPHWTLLTASQDAADTSH